MEGDRHQENNDITLPITFQHASSSGGELQLQETFSKEMRGAVLSLSLPCSCWSNLTPSPSRSCGQWETQNRNTVACEAERLLLAGPPRLCKNTLAWPGDRSVFSLICLLVPVRLPIRCSPGGQNAPLQGPGGNKRAGVEKNLVWNQYSSQYYSYSKTFHNVGRGYNSFASSA